MWQITTHLPTDIQYPNVGVGIAEVYHGRSPRLLSVEEGLCAVRCLTTRLLIHATHTERRMSSIGGTGDPQPYNFWTQQSRLEECLNCLHAVIEPWNFPPSSAGHYPDSTPMLLGWHVKALFVVLGETKLAKMHTNCGLGLDQGQILSCEDAVHQISLELATVLENNMGKMVPSNAATNITVSWITYVTLQSLLRYQQRQRRIASWPSFGHLDELNMSKNTISASSVAETCLDLNDNFMTDIASPSSATSASGFSWSSSTTTLTDALVLDTFEALQSKLSQSASNLPVAAFFSEHIQPEMKCSLDDVRMPMVGLADSTGSPIGKTFEWEDGLTVYLGR
jgi:hypothetical protein